MAFLVRLYGIEGCQFCQQAGNFLSQNGVPFQYLQVDNDPVITEGLKVVLGLGPQDPVPAPVLVSKLTMETLVYKGFERDQYVSVVAHFRARARAESTYKLANDGESVGEPKEVVK